MSQHDQNIANSDGATVRADINNALGAIFSLSSGTSAPGTTVAHQLWADTTSNLLKKRNAANSGWLVVRTLDESLVLSRSSNTILGVSDVGKTIFATSTFTQTLTAAATLGDGWFVDYVNDGTGAITLDPNSSETIDGAATAVLASGESVRIACNGSAFRLLFRERGTATNDSAAAGVVGELLSSTLASGSAISLTNDVSADVTSVSLTAGDWDVWATAIFTGNAATTVTQLNASISTTSATVDGTIGRLSNRTSASYTAFAVGINTLGCGPARISLASTTTVYLVATATFATNTASAYGGIFARRRR